MTRPLQTARLTLRPIGRDDVDLLVELDSDPEVMAFLTGGKPSTRQQIIETIEKEIDSRWVAFEKDSGSFVGWFGIPGDGNGLELGYRLERQFWGKGYATEGSLAVVDFAFNELRAQRVWAQTMFVNSRSRRVMERLGMAHVRTFHEEWDDPIPGTELGEVEYELTRETWLARAAPQPSSGN